MEDSTPAIYPGLNRIQYFGILMGMAIVKAILTIWSGPTSPLVSYLRLPILIAGFILIVFRIRNIGISRWFAFLMLIPFVSAPLGIFLLAAQPGWAETRRLDQSGKIIAGIFIGLYLLVILALLMMYFYAGSFIL